MITAKEAFERSISNKAYKIVLKTNEAIRLESYDKR